MKSMGKNIILMLALGAVIIMMLGIFLYDYMPTGITVSEANQYQTEPKTTQVLSDVSDINERTNSNSDSSSAQPTVILQTYNVGKSDLAIYRASGAYVPGRSNPFAEINTGTSTQTGTTSSSSSSSSASTSSTSSGNTTTTTTTTTTTNVVSDGTFYNSTHTNKV